MARYSIYPVYGDASVWVVDADSLKGAIEQAFNVKIEAISKIHVDVIDENSSQPCIFYAIVGALGKRPTLRDVTMLCSATVLTYSEIPSLRKAADLLSVVEFVRGDIVYESSSA